jgi:hypothetical protein
MMGRRVSRSSFARLDSVAPCEFRRVAEFAVRRPFLIQHSPEAGALELALPARGVAVAKSRDPARGRRGHSREAAAAGETASTSMICDVNSA